MAMFNQYEASPYSLGSGFQTQATPATAYPTGVPQTTPTSTLVDIYGTGNRNNTNQGLSDSIKNANAAWLADTNASRVGEDVGTGEYSNLQGIGTGPKFLAQALLGQGIDPTPYADVDLGLLHSVLGYNGVNDPMKVLNMIKDAGPGWQDQAGYRDAIAYAVANNLTPADAQKYKTDYLSSHSAGTNSINNAIKAGLVAMTAMAGAGMAGYGPAASGGGSLSAVGSGALESAPALGAAGSEGLPALTGMPIESGGFVGGGAGASASSGLPALTGMPIESGGFVNLPAGATTGTTATSLATSNVGKVLGNILDNGSGIRDLAQAGATLWSAGKGSESATQNQGVINNQIKTLTDMFGQDSPYAKQLRQTLERKDAAAGRNSQYGNRETQLQALLAEKAMQASGAIGDLSKQSSALDNSVTAGRNSQLNALDQILNKTGVYDWTKDWASKGLSSLFGG